MCCLLLALVSVTAMRFVLNAFLAAPTDHKKSRRTLRAMTYQPHGALPTPNPPSIFTLRVPSPPPPLPLQQTSPTMA